MAAIEKTIPIVLLLALTACRHAPAPLADEHLSPAQVADRAKPATVAIYHEFEVTGTVRSMRVDKAKLIEDVRSRVTFSDTQEQILTRFYGLFLNDPERYLQPGGTQPINGKFAVMGSGFIVSPDGYLVTNDHVIKPDKDDIAKEALSSIHDLVAQDIDDLRRGMDSLLPGREMSDDDASRITDVLLKAYAQSAQFDYKQSLAVIMPSADNGKDGVSMLPAAVEKEGAPFPGKDIAILKIQGRDLPTLAISPAVSDGTLRTGDDLVILGYPGKVTSDDSFTLSSRLQPSLSTGRVSGIKETQQGWRVIQTETTINHGNSGGPVMNDAGDVVGVATFSETESTGLNFAIDVAVARDFLSQLNVTARESDFTRQYDLALDQYDRPAHGQALRLFRALSESHPESVNVRDFVQQLGGKSDTSPPQSQTRSPPQNRIQPEIKPDAETSSTRPHRRPFNPILLLLIPGLAVILIAAAFASRR